MTGPVSADCSVTATSASKPAFAPESCVEAEAGDITAPMARGSDGDASGGAYVATLNEATTNNGSVSFLFNVVTAGSYAMQARVKTGTTGGANNSFFVGLDSEAAAGDTSFTYDTAQSSSYVWDNVKRRGTGTSAPQFDPMIWSLSAGPHSFAFYGDEANTRLDEIVLKLCPTPACTGMPLGCGSTGADAGLAPDAGTTPTSDASNPGSGADASAAGDADGGAVHQGDAGTVGAAKKGCGCTSSSDAAGLLGFLAAGAGLLVRRKMGRSPHFRRAARLSSPR
jgi:MYXO-CTERM domain-containing protein